jgi:protein gp37
MINFYHKTVNPFYGCKKVSPGCANCYAEKIEKRSCHHSLVDAQGHWTGQAICVSDAFNKVSIRSKVGKLWFNSMGDLCHEDYAVNDWNWLFLECRLRPKHTFMFQTKRSHRLKLLPAIPSNVWIGVTVENDDYKFRLDDLRNIGHPNAFVSFEPLLGPVSDPDMSGIRWCYIGGESGPGHRLCAVGWIEDLVKSCQAQSCLVWVKQLGTYLAQEHGLKGSAHDPTLWPVSLLHLNCREHFDPGFAQPSSEAQGGV